jgi:uncharacterized membrane protein YjjP (DUF1212 family)
MKQYIGNKNNIMYNGCVKVEGAKYMKETGEKAGQYLGIALDIGAAMLRSGAEINRAEESVYRICKALGATKVEVYAVNYLIMLTASGEGYSGVTESRRVWRHDRNLTKLTELNELSRNICDGKLAYQEIQARLEEMEEMKEWNLVQLMLIYALISGSFTIFFGGDGVDMLVSAAIGVLVAPVDRLLSVLRLNNFVRVGLCALFCGLIAMVVYTLGMDVSTDMIGIGNIMIFIPGVLFTIAMQEILANNMLSGISKIVESIVLSLVIAAGFAIVTAQFL